MSNPIALAVQAYGNSTLNIKKIGHRSIKKTMRK